MIAPSELAPGPTPIEELCRLTAYVGGPRLLIKRDDVFPLGGGGNKLRKLKHLLEDALARGADTIITGGAIQSNHARLTAAAAARLGLRCILVLMDSVAYRGPAYKTGGNVLLDRIFGADVRITSKEVDSIEAMQEVANFERHSGHSPYVIPSGGSNALGARGYEEAFAEIMSQTTSGAKSDIDIIIHASGSGGTQAGLLAGAAQSDWNGQIIGISVGASAETQSEKIQAILRSMPDTQTRNCQPILVDDRFTGPSYGVPSEETLEAIRLVARLEGLLLDPVYTGKAAQGLLKLIGEKQLRAGQTVLFLHTGGAPSLSAYADQL